MEYINVKFDLENTKRLYKKHVEYMQSRNRFFSTFAWVAGCLLVIALIGIYLNSSLLAYSAGAGASIFIVAAAYNLFVFKFQKYRYFKVLEKENETKNLNFKFGFGNDGISYVKEAETINLLWNKFENYTEDGGEIYLFETKDILYDIFSESIMGAESFARFREVLTQNVKKK